MILWQKRSSHSVVHVSNRPIDDIVDQPWSAAVLKHMLEHIGRRPFEQNDASVFAGDPIHLLSVGGNRDSLQRLVEKIRRPLACSRSSSGIVSSSVCILTSRAISGRKPP